MRRVLFERAVIVATIVCAAAATGCSKKDNYAADTTSASMQTVDTTSASSTRTIAPDTASSKSAPAPATKTTTAKKKAPTKTTY